MSEHSTAQVIASVMLFDNIRQWHPSGSAGLSRVNIYHHPINKTFRIVGRKLNDHAVVINYALTRGLKYNKGNPTFHLWSDQRQVYGLNFQSKEYAETFGEAVRNALETLKQAALPAAAASAPQSQLELVNYGQGTRQGQAMAQTQQRQNSDMKPCSEHITAQVIASVMLFDKIRQWHPSGSAGFSRVNLYHHPINNTFRIVGRKLNNNAVVINCALTYFIEYNKTTPTFHQWSDQCQVYGLDFQNKYGDAETFSEAVINALKTLKQAALPAETKLHPSIKNPGYAPKDNFVAVVVDQKNPDLTLPSPPKRNMDQITGQTSYQETCTICDDLPPDVIFEPCRHIIACQACAWKMRRCLKCNTQIERKVTHDGETLKEPMVSTQASMDRVNELTKELDEVKRDVDCQICMDQRCNTLFNCGHKTCSECSEQISQCPYCNANITERKIMY